MHINERQEKLIETFAPFEEWFDKYERLIQLANNLTPMDSTYKTEQNEISGCQSKLWLAAEVSDGCMVFHADSDAKITKGIIAVVLFVLNNQRPSDIAAADLYCLDAIGLSSHLSPSRANGLTAILTRIRNLAEEHL